MSSNETMYRQGEDMPGLQIEVQRINDGLGFGEGTISGAPDTLTPHINTALDATIKNDPNLIVPIDVDKSGKQIDDDGCGDGRGVNLVLRGTEVLKRSLNRAKVFGGGLTMTMAARIGLGKARGKNLNEVFEDAGAEADKRQVEYGAHTDESAHGPNCGCGAIDKAPMAVANAVKYEDKIRSTIAALGVDSTGLNEVYEEYKAYATSIIDKPFSGSRVMEFISKKAKVVKQLAGTHSEKRIILNTVENTTVNQELIRVVTDGKAQVFATDVWRLNRIAQKLEPTDEVARNKVFLSELIYTLGVAATLTPGNLPVYIVTRNQVALAA